MAANLNLEVPRNGHYAQGWVLNDNEGAPIDLAGHALELKIRAVAGQGGVLATAAIDIYDAPSGRFTVEINGADLAALDGSSEIVRLAYDLAHTYPDGVEMVPVRGLILLMPGVTY